jgi:hypothetical protein
MNLSLPASLSFQEREEQIFKPIASQERGWGEVKF